MKKLKIIYWVTTAIVALMMTFSAYMYLTADEIKQAFVHLGFPSYFRIELAIAKIAGAILLLLPFKSKLKEWIYAGFTIVFVSAIIAHIASGDPAKVYSMPLMFLVVLFVSYYSYSKISFNKPVAKHTATLAV